MSEEKVEQTAQITTEAEATPDSSVDPAKQELAEKIFDEGNPKESPAKEQEPGEPEEKTEEGETEPDDKKQDEKPEDKEAEEVSVELPEGSKLSADDAKELTEMVKEFGLSKDQADKVLKTVESAVERFQESQIELLESQRVKWEKSFSDDKEIGGENANLSIRYAQKALNEFGSEDFKKELEKTKFGSHPEVIRVFARIGKAISDDNFVQAKQPNKEPKFMHNVFYNND